MRAFSNQVGILMACGWRWAFVITTRPHQARPALHPFAPVFCHDCLALTVYVYACTLCDSAPGVLGANLPPPESPLAPKEEADARTHTSAIVQWTVPVYVPSPLRGRECSKHSLRGRVQHSCVQGGGKLVSSVFKPCPPLLRALLAAGTMVMPLTATKSAILTWARASGCRCVMGWDWQRGFLLLPSSLSLSHTTTRTGTHSRSHHLVTAFSHCYFCCLLPSPPPSPTHARFTTTVILRIPTTPQASRR